MNRGIKVGKMTMKRLILVLVFPLIFLLGIAFGTTSNVSIKNVCPEISAINIIPIGIIISSTGGIQIINATANVSDANGYGDINQSLSSCSWNNSNNLVNSIPIFSSCNGENCTMTCQKNFSSLSAPNTYTVSMTVIDNGGLSNSSNSLFNLTNDFAPPITNKPPVNNNRAKKSLPLSYGFDCSAGIIELNTGSVEGVTITITKISFAQDIQTNITNSDGKAQFIITNDGDYWVHASKNHYRNAYLRDIELKLCPEKTENQSECNLDSDCKLNEYCLNLNCTQIKGECGYVDNHTWVSYDCCENTDCLEGQVCTDHACVVNEQNTTLNNTSNNTTKQFIIEVNASINDAKIKILNAKTIGLNITNAESELRKAQLAFMNGDYMKAKLLVDEAINRIPKILAQNEINGQKYLDNLYICIGGLIVIIILGAGIYIFY